MRWIKFISKAALSLFLFHLLIGLSPDNVQVRAEDRAEITDAGTEISKNVSFIDLKHDHLSVKVQDILLKEILEEIARQGGIALRVYASMEERVTLELHGIPLEEGLQRILRYHSFAMEYGKKTSEDTQSVVSRPKKLWIYDRKEEYTPSEIAGTRKSAGEKTYEGSQPVVMNAPPGLQNAMMSEYPEERKEAYESIFKALPGEDSEVLEEVEESLREFEEAMMEH